MDFKKNQIVMVICALIGLAIIGGSTAILLHFLGDRTSVDTPVQNEKTPLSKAEALEAEATELAVPNPAKAREKFAEAEAAYKEAGNEAKVSEMAEARESLAPVEFTGKIPPEVPQTAGGGAN